nr:hypothetical protein KitaXyl93_74500 [Kitasatospora sp. Xyl93]
MESTDTVQPMSPESSAAARSACGRARRGGARYWAAGVEGPNSAWWTVKPPRMTGANGAGAMQVPTTGW